MSLNTSYSSNTAALLTDLEVSKSLLRLSSSYIICAPLNLLPAVATKVASVMALSSPIMLRSRVKSSMSLGVGSWLFAAATSTALVRVVGAIETAE